MLPKYQDSGRCRGYAIIEFDSAESQSKAIQLNRKELDGRYLEISIPLQKEGLSIEEIKKKRKQVNENTQTIFVKNLPYGITEKEVGDLFSVYGRVINVRFVYNGVHGHFKGFAYIDFEKSFSVASALGMNGKLVDGRPLYIDIDTGSRKAGFKIKKESKDTNPYNQEYSY